MQVTESLSWDSIDQADQDTAFSTIPVEVLNQLKPSSLPPHKLLLKVGAPIILLRNICAARGLANGTRLIVVRFTSRVIEARIVSGSKIGSIALLPRINMTSDNSSQPFVLRRRQFPVRLAFAMSINKAQGQTLDMVGLYLPQPVFAHGQYYTGASRVGDEDGICVCVAEDSVDEDGRAFTRNEVWPELLLRR